MYRLKNKYTIFTLLLLLSAAALQAQVSIGSLENPESGMLLQIKSKEVTSPSTDNTTVDANGGGILLPRVQLVSKTTLQPFIELSDAEWNSSNQARTKMKHAGLMVYNINASAVFRQGTYVWDGEQWEEAGSPNKWFYMPPFNLPVDELGPKTFDLYAEYEKQFTESQNGALFISSKTTYSTVPSPGNGSLYTESELDYAVVHYDEDVLEVTGIDENGVMSYTVKDIDPASTSFMTIVFIVK